MSEQRYAIHPEFADMYDPDFSKAFYMRVDSRKVVNGFVHTYAQSTAEGPDLTKTIQDTWEELITIEEYQAIKLAK